MAVNESQVWYRVSKDFGGWRWEFLKGNVILDFGISDNRDSALDIVRTLRDKYFDSK